MLELPSAWLAPNVEQLYPHIDAGGRVFKHVAPDQLPPLARVDGSFDWLPPLPEGHQPLPIVFYDGQNITEDSEAVARQVAQIAEQARAQALELPAPFVTFTRSPAFAGRIASVAGGYFEVGKLEPLPHHTGPERLVRFFMDPQTFQWALLLEPGGRHRVIFANPDRTNRTDELTGITTCAPSFVTFIQRFRIENAIAWYLLANEPVPKGELRRYLAAAGYSPAP